MGDIYSIIADLPRIYTADQYNRRQCVQLQEIDRILQREKVKTVYREEYVDRHFIHDFCGHYGSCFQDYPKKCIRLHFFKKNFSLRQFKSMLADPEKASNWQEYLGEYVGFIVLRPIPQAILGNVSLKAPSDNKNSHYLKKTIESHLCGLRLEVQTIPFQEQDNAISACATAALWMALHAIPGRLPYAVPSPHKLTGNARKVTEEGFKSHKITKGLTISQMARAVKEEELEPLVCVPHSTSYAKALIRAYANAQIPVVLGIELYFRSDAPSDTVLDRAIGNHAVTVLGWREDNKIQEFDAPDMANNFISLRGDVMSNHAEKWEKNRFFLQASSMKELYCHDDQIGPYSLISFKDEYSSGLTTEWSRIYNGVTVDAMIVSVLVPCSPKVRIRFSNIYEVIKVLNLLLYPYYNELSYNLIWYIRLETVCNYTKEIIAENSLNSEAKFEVLSTSFPRFIWVVDQYLQKIDEKETDGEITQSDSKQKVASFIFDATDIQNSDFLVRVIHYNNESYNANKAILEEAFSEYESEDMEFNNVPSIIRHLMEHYETDKDCKIVKN